MKEKIPTTFEKNLKRLNDIKKINPGVIVLFRDGDFCEAYREDAKDVHTILGLTLTQRDGVPLAGFPYHAFDTYLPKLMRAGKRVALCEQREKPDA